jgi:pentatricopeptide repeat protein
MFSWNRRLARYARVGQHEKTVELSQEMQQKGTTPDTDALWFQCSMHVLVYEHLKRADGLMDRFEAHVFVGCSLVDMHAKCGSMEDVQRVFNKMPSRDVVTWTALILGHVKCSQGQKALEMV